MMHLRETKPTNRIGDDAFLKTQKSLVHESEHESQLTVLGTAAEPLTISKTAKTHTPEGASEWYLAMIFTASSFTFLAAPFFSAV